jgi:hypothetical protein
MRCTARCGLCPRQAPWSARTRGTRSCAESVRVHSRYPTRGGENRLGARDVDESNAARRETHVSKRRRVKCEPGVRGRVPLDAVRTGGTSRRASTRRAPLPVLPSGPPRASPVRRRSPDVRPCTRRRLDAPAVSARCSCLHSMPACVWASEPKDLQWFAERHRDGGQLAAGSRDARSRRSAWSRSSRTIVCQRVSGPVGHADVS